MYAVRPEIVILPLFAVGNNRESLLLQKLQWWLEWHLHNEERGWDPLCPPFATLSMRSRGLGILPIGSVGIVIGAGLAILTVLRQRI
jgi:hypothetical protein